MDLSKLKWPIIIFLVVLVVWLTTDPGVDFMYAHYRRDPGDDAKRAERYEAGLSRLGGFLLTTLRYQKAEYVFQDVLELYPEGKNFWFNLYRLARVEEKLGKYPQAVEILRMLMAENAHAKDGRVPHNDVLKPRRDKLIAVHELDKY